MKPLCRCGILPLLAVFACLLSGLPRQVRAQQNQSTQEALLVYRDAAAFQNNGAFELAAEEWERFLTRYPKDPLAARAKHYLGICNLQLKRYPQAIEAFASVVSEHPDFESIQDSYLNLGWCQYTLGGQGDAAMYAQAAETFTALLKNHPESKYRDQGLFFLGEAEYHRDRKEQAAAAYAKLIEGFPESPLRTDALYALGVTYEELGQHARAGQIYDTFLQESSDSTLVTEVRMRKAETILQAGDYAAAAEAFAEVAAVPDFGSADHALYRQAFSLSQLERFGEAGKLYARIATDHPQSEYASEAAMSAGRCFYRAEQFPAAAEWFQTAMDNGGEAVAEAAHWLCRIALNEGQPQRVLELTEQILPKASESPYFVHLKMNQADALYETPDSKPDSLQIYLEVASDHPQHELAPQALYNAAFTSLELKQHDEALRHTTAFIEAHPEHRLLPDAQYVAAESHLQLSRHAQAETAYRELLESYPQHAEANAWQLRLGLALYLQKKYQDLLATLGPVVDDLQTAESIAEARYLIGASQFFLEQHPAAIETLKASLEAEPQWRQADEATLLLSRAQRAAGQLDQALQTVQQMIADFPNSRALDQAHYRHGEYAYAAEDFATAAAEYEAVLEGWPQSAFAAFAWYGKGWSDLKSRQYETAIDAFSRVITDHAEHQLVPDAHFARALCRRQAGQYEGVIEDVDLFLASEPERANRSDALYERGLAEVALNRLDQAIPTFQQLLEADPEYAAADKVLYEIAWSYKSMEDRARQDEAVAVFARLAEEHPGSPLAAEAHFHVGEALYDQREFDKAAAEYAAAQSKAKQEDLGEKSTYKLGWSRFQQQDYAAALQQFTQQSEKYADGSLAPDALFMIAECLYRQEDYEQALPAYLAAQKVTLSSPTLATLALLHGGQSASQLKQWDQAIQMLTRLLEEYEDSPHRPEAHFELAAAQQKAGDEDAALKHYEQAAERSRGAVGARARFMIGQIFFGRKQYDQAIREFQRVMLGFGADAAADDVKPWQAKAAFEAARCAEVQIGDTQGSARANRLAEARKFYQHLVDRHPQDELVEPARKRLEALSQL